MKISVDLSDSSPEIPRVGPPKEMLSVTKLTDGGTKVRINSSSLSLIQECLRKTKYRLVDKWTSETESPATIFGTAIHKALEVFYYGTPDERKLPKLEDMELMSYGHRVDGDEDDLLLRATRAFVLKGERLRMLPESDKRSVQNGVYILWHYFKAYLNDPYVAYVDDSGPFVERPFSFTLLDTPTFVIEYFGTIDLIVRHLDTSEKLVADHKTSSVVGNEFYARIKPNHQYTGYLMGAKRAFGLDINSFLVNCVQVKEKPKTSRGTPPHFPRQITTRDEYDYREFVQAVYRAATSYLEELEMVRAWPLGHVNACASYGGCTFLSVCSAPNSLRENILKSKFIQPKEQNEEIK